MKEPIDPLQTMAVFYDKPKARLMTQSGPVKLKKLKDLNYMMRQHHQSPIK
jgi:hypothetical protein